MSILSRCFQARAIILSATLLSMLLISCSEQENTDNSRFDHPHPKTIDLKKHLFEHEFAQQCVARETIKQVNANVVRERLAESCLCMATYLFKDLAAEESYKLLNNKKTAQSMKRKYEEAAKHCL